MGEKCNRLVILSVIEKLLYLLNILITAVYNTAVVIRTAFRRTACPQRFFIQHYFFLRNAAEETCSHIAVSDRLTLLLPLVKFTGSCKQYFALHKISYLSISVFNA